MKKIYYLKTCDSCSRILKLFPINGFSSQEIKTQPITIEQIEEMKNFAGNYESLFSRRAKKYTAMGLKDQTLEEVDYKQLILSDYTFLKRPVIIIDKDIYIGNDKKNINALQQRFTSV
jgi:arsenate reductase-like glutaredoxin family protein